MPYLNHEDFAKVQEALDRAHLHAVQPEGVLTLYRDAQKCMARAVEHVASPGLRELAHELHGSDEIEIDDEGVGTSDGGDGTWVQAWVWVPREDQIEAGLIEREEESEED